jgi:hypothetical protein
MNAALIIATVFVAPILLFPVALVWYINIGGMVQAMRERQKAGEPEKAAC